jgi:hypothetical protein
MSGLLKKQIGESSGQLRRLSRKDILGRTIHVGDWVRLKMIPPSISKMPKETQIVFKKALDKTFKIVSINKYNLAELDISRKVAKNNWIWVEPEYLLIFRRKQNKRK